MPRDVLGALLVLGCLATVGCGETERSPKEDPSNVWEEQIARYKRIDERIRSQIPDPTHEPVAPVPIVHTAGPRSLVRVAARTTDKGKIVYDVSGGGAATVLFTIDPDASPDAATHKSRRAAVRAAAIPDGPVDLAIGAGAPHGVVAEVLDALLGAGHSEVRFVPLLMKPAGRPR